MGIMADHMDPITSSPIVRVLNEDVAGDVARVV
jgi:hypothetical protein